MVQSYILHCIKSNFARVECRGKAFQAIICLHSFPRATQRLPPVTYIGKPMCIAFQASLSCPPDLSGEPIKCDNRVVANITPWASFFKTELSLTQPRGYNLKLTTKQMPHGKHLFMGFPCGVCMKIRSVYFRSVYIVFVLVSGGRTSYKLVFQSTPKRNGVAR